MTSTTDGEVVEFRSLETSGTVGAIASALAKAQGQITGAKKDAVNPHFRSRYADLASVWEACRAPLSQNELAVVQMTENAGPSGLCLVSMLVHSSGEFFRSRLYLALRDPSPQAVGSAITYARRYALAALVGVAAEDDDGEEAQRTVAAANTQAPAPAPARPKRTEADAARDMEQMMRSAASAAEIAEIWARIGQMPFKDGVRSELRKAYDRELARFLEKAG
jgi:ERF superfamily